MTSRKIRKKRRWLNSQLTPSRSETLFTINELPTEKNDRRHLEKRCRFLFERAPQRAASENPPIVGGFKRAYSFAKKKGLPCNRAADQRSLIERSFHVYRQLEFSTHLLELQVPHRLRAEIPEEGLLRAEEARDRADPPQALRVEGHRDP